MLTMILQTTVALMGLAVLVRDLGLCAVRGNWPLLSPAVPLAPVVPVVAKLKNTEFGSGCCYIVICAFLPATNTF